MFASLNLIHTGFSARTDLSPDHRFVAVSNVSTGFDVYELKTSAPVRNLLHKTGGKHCLPVLYAHYGQALVGGSPSGIVALWDAKSGTRLHNLTHPGPSPYLPYCKYTDQRSRQPGYFEHSGMSITHPVIQWF